jgi:phosphoglycolate phosphatase
MKAAVFDLDGTLIHSLPDIHAAVASVLQAEGLPPLDIQTVGSFVGNGLPRLVELVIEEIGVNPSRLDAMTEQVQAQYKKENGRLTRTYRGVEACLANLADQNLVMGICTNKPEEPARDIVHHLGIARYFPVIIGGDTLQHRKPDPAPLLETIARLNVSPSEAIFVGDSEVDAATAAAASVPFALYTEGYRKSQVSELPHDLVFDHFDHLPAKLASLE